MDIWTFYKKYVSNIKGEGGLDLYYIRRFVIDNHRKSVYWGKGSGRR